MKECLTEFEELQEALKKVDMDYDVMPFVRGKLCESESYNKMKKILATPELIKSHRWCLNLDPEQLSEDEIDKIDRIYSLGVDRGFIERPDDGSLEADDIAPKEDLPAVQAPEPQTLKQTFKAKIPCWTILYSAMKNGEIKTGQCFSNAYDIRAAKADCFAKLSRFGYDNISILAIEAGDPDNCDCNSEDPFDQEEVDDTSDIDRMADDCMDTCDEDDILKKTPHNGDAQHNGHIEEDEEVDEDNEELDESGNPYLKGMKTANIGGASSLSSGSVKKPSKPKKSSIKEDDEDQEDSSEEETTEDSADSSDSEETSDDSSESSEESSDVSSDSDDTEGDSSDAEESTDDTEDDSSDDSEETTDSSDEDTSDSSDDSSEGDSDDASDSEDSEKTDSEDAEGTESDEDSEETSDDEESSEDDSDDADSSDEKEIKNDLSDDEKTEMKNEYKKTFKSTMEKCKFEDKCFDDLTIDEKVKFFTALNKAWKKNDPNDFMDDKEVEQLNKIVIQK